MYSFVFLFFPCCSYSLIYVNLLYLSLFNFAFLYYLFFSLFFSPCLLVCFAFVSLLPSWHTTLVLFSVYALISFVFNWLVSFLPSFARLVNLFYFLFLGDCFGVFYVCIYIYSIIFVSICLIL